MIYPSPAGVPHRAGAREAGAPVGEHQAVAGALITASANQDGEALLVALRAVREHGDPVGVMLVLAATAADLLVELCGDAWPDALRTALLPAAGNGAGQ